MSGGLSTDVEHKRMHLDNLLLLPKHIGGRSAIWSSPPNRVRTRAQVSHTRDKLAHGFDQIDTSCAGASGRHIRCTLHTSNVHVFQQMYVSRDTHARVTMCARDLSFRCGFMIISSSINTTTVRLGSSHENTRRFAPPWVWGCTLCIQRWGPEQTSWTSMMCALELQTLTQ